MELFKNRRNYGDSLGDLDSIESVTRNLMILIMRGSASYNMPTSKSIDLDLFKVKERTNVQFNGSIEVTRTSMVTGKGQIYFINKFLAIQKEV